MSSCCAATARPSLKDTQKVEELQAKIVVALRDHCSPHHPRLLPSLLGRLPQLRTLSHEGARQLASLRQRCGLTARGGSSSDHVTASIESVLAGEGVF